MPGWLRLINGPQTLGRGPVFWIVFVLTIAAAVVYPAFADAWSVGNTAYFFCWVFMALGLSLIWGYAGSLSFGQTAFFGLAGYTYGVVTINFGAAYGLTIVGVLLGVGMSCLGAAVLGYILFMGELAAYSSVLSPCRPRWYLPPLWHRRLGPSGQSAMPDWVATMA